MTFRTPYTHYSVERIVNIMERNPDRMSFQVWKDFTMKGVVVTEKALKSIKAKTINSYWRKLSRCA